MTRKFETAFEPAEAQRVLKDFDTWRGTRVSIEDLSDRGIGSPLLGALSKRLPAGAWVAGGCFESLIRGEEPRIGGARHGTPA